MKIKTTDRKKFYDLFVNRSDVYAVQQSDGGYFPEKEELTEDKFFNSKTIGLYQLDQENKVKWAVLDIDIKKEIWKQDNFNVDAWNNKLLEQVQTSSDILKKVGIHPLVEFSGNKGYHLWIFFNAAIGACRVKSWMEKLFLDMKAADPAITWEIFPKQSMIGENGLGNLVKAPLHLHKKSGRHSYFLDEKYKIINGMPEIDKYNAALIPHIETPQTLAYKERNATDPIPSEKLKEIANNCMYFKTLIDNAESNGYLNHAERIWLANILKKFGEKTVHKYFSCLKDYNRNLTQSHLDSLKGNPSLCYSACKNNLCDNIKERGNRSPIAFAYNKLIDPERPWGFIEGISTGYHYFLDDEIIPLKGKAVLKDIYKSFYLEFPNVLPFFKFKFDVHDDCQINFKAKTINLFTPTEYLQLDKTNEVIIPKKHFPSINRLLTNLIPEDKERELFINWLSTIVNTRENQMTAWVLNGGQGHGKNLFFNKVLQPILGKKQTKIIDDKTLKSDWNGYMMDVFFIAFNEVANTNADRNKLNSVIKSIVTDDEHVIHMKFINPFTITNSTNCIFFSNEKVPLIVENDDRRFNIVQTAGKLIYKEWFKNNPSAFIDKISTELPKFAQYLRNYPYDADKAKTVFSNDIKRRIMSAGMNKFEEFALKLKTKDGEWFSENTEDSIDIDLNFSNHSFLNNQIERNTAKLIFNAIYGEEITLNKLTTKLELYGITVKKSGSTRFYVW